MPRCESLEALILLAERYGVSAAAIIPARAIWVRPQLAEKCRPPSCAYYGRSLSCPPYVPDPEAFTRQLQDYHQALFFQFDLPVEVLLSPSALAWFRRLHRTAARLEKRAGEKGFEKARALAGGSCKRIFCHRYSDCRALKEGGQCRNPDKARPSMSGLGIDVVKLFEAAGWTFLKVETDAIQKTAPICGLVLLR